LLSNQISEASRDDWRIAKTDEFARRQRKPIGRFVRENGAVIIKQLESQLARLDSKISARQTELADLKARRREVKTRLAEAKEALKECKTPPPESDDASLAGRLGTVLTATVIEPIAELLCPAPEKS
jgi:hypothetical protein